MAQQERREIVGLHVVGQPVPVNQTDRVQQFGDGWIIRRIADGYEVESRVNGATLQLTHVPCVATLAPTEKAKG